MKALDLHIGLIKYLNSLPIYENLSGTPRFLEMQLPEAPTGSLTLNLFFHYGEPQELNRNFSIGQTDFSFISSIESRGMDAGRAFSRRLGLFAKGRVGSVIVAGASGIGELKGTKISLPPHSRTAVAMLSVLLSEAGVKPARLDYSPISQSPGDRCVRLLIGDEALLHKKTRARSPFFDLGALWKDIFGRPFVYSVFAFSECRLLAESFRGIDMSKIEAALVDFFKREYETVFSSDPDRFVCRNWDRISPYFSDRSDALDYFTALEYFPESEQSYLEALEFFQSRYAALMAGLPEIEACALALQLTDHV